MKTGDTGEPLVIQIINKSDRRAVVLTSATVVFKMSRVEDDSTLTNVVNAAATVTDATNGIITYTWVAGDLDTAGLYIGTFTITYSSGVVETYPRDGYIEINIDAAL